jgi:hypothetical protein
VVAKGQPPTLQRDERLEVHIVGVLDTRQASNRVCCRALADADQCRLLAGWHIPGANRFAVRAIATRPTFTFSDPNPIPRGFTEGTSPAFQRNYDMLPDGRSLGIIVSAANQPGGPLGGQIEVVVNWYEELKLRAPAK